jgi:hypothetical protein
MLQILRSPSSQNYAIQPGRRVSPLQTSKRRPGPRLNPRSHWSSSAPNLRLRPSGRRRNSPLPTSRRSPKACAHHLPLARSSLLQDGALRLRPRRRRSRGKEGSRVQAEAVRGIHGGEGAGARAAAAVPRVGAAVAVVVALLLPPPTPPLLAVPGGVRMQEVVPAAPDSEICPFPFAAIEYFRSSVWRLLKCPIRSRRML